MKIHFHSSCRFFECVAWALSVVFHPLFVPFYVLLVFFQISHYLFYDLNKIIRLIFLSTVVVPLLLVFLFYKLKILRSVFLYRIKSRILFTALLGVIYYSLYKALLPVTVLDFVGLFFRGIAFSLLLSLVFYAFRMKISLHALACGGAWAFFIFWSYTFKTNILDILAVIIFITTMIMAARLRLGAHNLKEIFWGFVIGLTGQIISFWLF